MTEAARTVAHSESTRGRGTMGYGSCDALERASGSEGAKLKAGLTPIWWGESCLQELFRASVGPES